jgi:hypothetical protein
MMDTAYQAAGTAATESKKSEKQPLKTIDGFEVNQIAAPN